MAESPHDACHAGVVHDLSLDEFEKIVGDEIEALPNEMVAGLDNVVFAVEDRPSNEQPDLLGVYDGIALTERGQYGFGEVPDRIVLYRETHQALCDDVAELRKQIHVTLVHEIAHFFGIDDDKLHELGWG